MKRSSKITGKIISVLFIATIFHLGIFTFTVHAQDDGLIPTFVLLAPQHNDQPTLDQLQKFIEDNGGRMTHVFPYRAMIAKIPYSIVQQISTLSGVAAVFTEPVELSMMDVYGPESRQLAGVWNSLVASPTSEPAISTAAAEHPEDHNDAFTAPDLPENDNKIGIASSGSVTPGYYQTSEYMTGSVAVGIILVESNGSVDASTEDWTTDEKQLVFNEIVAGLNWWADMEPRANLSFVYDDHFSNPLPTSVEPVTRPYSHQQYWITDAMSALGYNTSSYFTRVRDYNNAIRAAYQTDWAFTIFVVDSSNDSDNRFSDGYFAYAYLGGPFTVLTSGNNGYGPYNMDAVLAHETGHIFRALDQYYSAYQSCTLRSGYLNVENQNSQYGGCTSNVTSIMRGQTYPYWAKAIDPYAAGQIGWRDSDGDNILDPLDTDLPVTIDTVTVEGDSVTVSGATEIIPYPSPSRASVTINTLSGVQYRFDAGDWQLATAVDNNFDGTVEDYQFTATSLNSGFHDLEVAALDSAGNVSEVYAAQTIAVLDPIDGGLNTEFYQSAGVASASAGTPISGLAYHMDGGIVTNVEYRINGGNWQSATAQDGAFDSNYEPFSLTVSPEVEAGVLRIEARAIDGNGYVEVNSASEEMMLTETSTVFLPFIIK